MNSEEYARLLASLEVMKMAIVGLGQIMAPPQREALIHILEDVVNSVQARKSEMMSAYAASLEETATSLIKGFRTGNPGWAMCLPSI